MCGYWVSGAGVEVSGVGVEVSGEGVREDPSGGGPITGACEDSAVGELSHSSHREYIDL